MAAIDMKRRGHVARAIAKYLKDHNLTVRTFNEQVLGAKPGSVVAYNWIAGRGLPGADYIPILAKALDKDPHFFAPRSEPQKRPEPVIPLIDETTTGVMLPQGVVITGIGAAALAEAEARTAPPRPPPAPRQPDGTMRGLVGFVDNATAERNRARAAVASAQQPVTKAKAKRKSRARIHIEPVKNSLSFLANGSGQATIKLEFTGHAESARKLFVALLDLDIGGA